MCPRTEAEMASHGTPSLADFPGPLMRSRGDVAGHGMIRVEMRSGPSERFGERGDSEADPSTPSERTRKPWAPSFPMISQVVRPPGDRQDLRQVGVHRRVNVEIVFRKPHAVFRRLVWVYLFMLFMHVARSTLLTPQHKRDTAHRNCMRLRRGPRARCRALFMLFMQ